MKKTHVYIVSIATLLFLSMSLSATNPRTDSLETVLGEHGLPEAEQIEVLNQLGYAYWTVDPAKSVLYGRKALRLASKYSRPAQQAFSYRVIGVAYWALGDYPLALDNMLKSLDLYEAQQDVTGVGNMLMNIGLVYSEQLSYQRAKGYFKRALEAFEETGESGRKATTLSKLASVLTTEESLDQAQEYLYQAIEIHRENGFQYGLAEAYNRLGILYYKRGDLHTALDYLYRSRDISQNISDQEGLTKCYYDIGNTFLQLANFPEAGKYYQMSLDKSYEVGSKKWRLKAYQGFYELAKSEADFPRALQYLENYQQLHDSVLNEQKVFAIANLQEEYESREQLRQLDRNKQEITHLQQEARIRQFGMLGLSGVFLLVAGASLVAYRYKQIKQREAALIQKREFQLMESETARREAEVENLRLQEISLKMELEQKHRELASYALNFVQKNEFINDLKKDLTTAGSGSSVLAIRKKLKQASRIDHDWENFRTQFENIHAGFLDKLKDLHPELTQGELRHCSLIRMNLSTRECASVLGISQESTKTARYRLRRKLKLEENIPVFDYLLALGK